jgi:hypothetical protein
MMFVLCFKEKLKMKKYLMAMIGVVVICLFIVGLSNAIAADANSPKEKPKEMPNEKAGDIKLVIGVVNMVKDNDGNITEIKVTAHRDLVYKVVLDEKGIDLGKTMLDKRARIEGTIEVKGSSQWLTVKTFGEVKAGAPANTKPIPKQKPAKPAKPAQPAPKSPPNQ